MFHKQFNVPSITCLYKYRIDTPLATPIYRSLRRKRKATYSVVQKHARQESSVSGTGDSASGFADNQGVEW